MNLAYDYFTVESAKRLGCAGIPSTIKEEEIILVRVWMDSKNKASYKFVTKSYDEYTNLLTELMSLQFEINSNKIDMTDMFATQDIHEENTA